MDPIASIFAVTSFRVFKSYFELLEKIFRLFIPNYSRPVALQKLLDAVGGPDIDARILKIDAARENLRDALAAIEELGQQAAANKAEVVSALTRIQEVESEKKAVSAELELLKQVAEADTAAFRKVVGVPTAGEIWRGRFLGFGSGVLASVVGAGIVWVFRFLVWR